MNGDSKYWLKEAYRYLALALIGTEGKAKKMVEKALDCLEKYEAEK
jgi:hypothetical protein